MANRFIDGFKHYGTLTQKWTSGSGTFSTATPRLPGAGYLTNPGSGATKTIDSQPTWTVGFGYRITAIPNQILISILDGATSQMDLRLTGTGQLQVTRGGTVLATSAVGLITAAVWNYIEFQTTINNTTGAYSVHLNGAAVSGLTATGVNTRMSANNTADTIALPNFPGGSTFDYSDFYMNDGTGSSPNNGFWGDTRIDTQVPTGAGNYTQWTPSTGSNWQNVDDMPPNSDTDYNSDSTVGHIDSFAVSSVVPLTGTVYARQVALFARKDDAGLRQIAPLFRHSTTDSVGTTVTLSTSYQYYFQLYETNPATSSAWTISDCNGDESGYKTIS
jgi:hypothetical protein